MSPPIRGDTSVFEKAQLRAENTYRWFALAGMGADFTNDTMDSRLNVSFPISLRVPCQYVHRAVAWCFVCCVA